MLGILEGLEGVVVHMDDVLVCGDNAVEHDQRLRWVLRRVRESGMTLNKGKCEFGKASVTFLGHRLDSQGVHVGEERIRSILEFHVSASAKDIQSFLRLVDQSAKFSPRAAQLSKPLRDLLQKDAQWIWETPQ